MNKKGFTLVEMLIVVAIFSILMVAILGAFTSILRVQRESFDLNYLTNQASYSLEYIGRQVRDSYLESVDSDKIIINKIEGGTVTIKKEEGGRIMIDDDYLTAKQIKVDSLEILSKEDDFYRITLLIKMSKNESELFLQQTVSLRNPQGGLFE